MAYRLGAGRPDDFAARPDGYCAGAEVMSACRDHFDAGRVHLRAGLDDFSAWLSHFSARLHRFSARPNHFVARVHRFSARPDHVWAGVDLMRGRPDDFWLRPDNFWMRPDNFCATPHEFCGRVQSMPELPDYLRAGSEVTFSRPDPMLREGARKEIVSSVAGLLRREASAVGIGSASFIPRCGMNPHSALRNGGGSRSDWIFRPRRELTPTMM
jgi:hypothetical protein